MTTHTAQESYGPGHRSFDCPWCGAISGVPPELIGETFQCPECKETTKLTPKNTRAAHLSEEPPGAPPAQEFTFDCPWCGAISPVSGAALGTAFTCPECGNQTRLTEKTTRRADLFVPPPGAPHHEEQKGVPPWLIAALIVVGLGVVAWAAFGRGGGDDTTGAGSLANRPAGTPGTPQAAPSEAGTPGETSTPGETDPEGAATPEAGEAQSPGETMPGETGPGETDPAEAAPPPPQEDPALAAAREALAEAERAHAAAMAAYEAWLGENAERVALARQVEAAERLRTLVQAEQEALTAAGPTPDAMKAANARLAKTIAAEPAAADIARAVWETLRADPFRPVRAATWQDLNFLAPRFGEVLEQRVGTGRLQLPAEHDALKRRVAESKAALDAARQALLDREAGEAAPPR